MLSGLMTEAKRSTTADIQRALEFLAWAREVRQGCTKQRTASRRKQSNAWRRHVDTPLSW
jgi:hypothetical protein